MEKALEAVEKLWELASVGVERNDAACIGVKES